MSAGRIVEGTLLALPVALTVGQAFGIIDILPYGAKDESLASS